MILKSMIRAPGGVLNSFFIWEGSAPRSKPLPFYISFLTEKVALSYTFHRKWYSFHIPTVETFSLLHQDSAFFKGNSETMRGQEHIFKLIFLPTFFWPFLPPLSSSLLNWSSPLVKICAQLSFSCLIVNSCSTSSTLHFAFWLHCNA